MTESIIFITLIIVLLYIAKKITALLHLAVIFHKIT